MLVGINTTVLLTKKHFDFCSVTLTITMENRKSDVESMDYVDMNLMTDGPINRPPNPPQINECSRDSTYQNTSKPKQTESESIYHAYKHF